MTWYNPEPEYCPIHPDVEIEGEIEDPYIMELRGVSHMMPNCRECYYEALMDI